ncbi:hypothetical protein TSUD_333180 [Trifolium subterraneum]|uniref:SKP1-like protein n=1 Tax=Trifolium subterraneum TaxID=3900 RepID=A0A2Z6N3U7_TRISU|nr:hypothetical protein TSUD_333180 [Trifolium subterraneum]
MSSSSTNKKITLKSYDGEAFEVDEAIALESKTIKHVIEDGITDKEIPVPNVTGKILAKVIEYCKTHLEADAAISNEKLSENDPHAKKDLVAWDAEFVNVDMATIFELIRASHYLDIKNLNDLVSKTVADMMRGKSTEEIRKMFNIKNDFTPEEEAQIKRENQWAFE